MRTLPVCAMKVSLFLPVVAVALQHQRRTGQHTDCISSVRGFDFPGPCIQKNYTECSKEVLPELIYLGMPHSGSSSLTVQLNMHPQLSYGKVKEHQYFVSAGEAWHTADS